MFGWIPKDLLQHSRSLCVLHTDITLSFPDQINPRKLIPIFQAVDQHSQDFLEVLHQFDTQVFQLWDVSEPGFAEPGLLHTVGLKLRETSRFPP